MFTVTQIRDNKIVTNSIWTNLVSVTEAVELIGTLKITGRDSVFSIENADGTVVEVVRT
jgi:hypothetical protein